MSLLGNILWIIFGGWLSALGWLIAGLLWCITVVGIPVGVQCFKLASLSLDPFGREVVYDGGAGSFLLNIVWFLVSGLELALGNLILGCLLCIAVLQNRQAVPRTVWRKDSQKVNIVSSAVSKGSEKSTRNISSSQNITH